MTNGEDFAYPQFGNNGGMTKRELFAAMAMQAMVVPYTDCEMKHFQSVANVSIAMADALIKALNNTEQST